MLITRRDEAGFLQFLVLALVVIGLVIAVIVALVLGLDSVYRGESSRSLFGKDAKITQLRDRALDVKEKFADRQRSEQAEQSSAEKSDETQTPRDDKSPDERLDDVHKRLKSGSR